MAATKQSSTPATVGDLLQPRPVPLNLDSHKTEIAQLRAEQEARSELMMRCCSHKVAAELEAKKPQYQWRVEFKLTERKRPENTPRDRFADEVDGDDDGDWKTRQIVKTVIAQDEATAWAIACDKLGEWPSPRQAKPKFTKLKQVKV